MIRRTGLIDGAVDTLRERITAGEWPVGTRIPPEPALATLLGVGRNTVREAVQSLVHAGLLARRQGSGTYVLSTSELTVTLGRQIADAHQRDVVQHLQDRLLIEQLRQRHARGQGTGLLGEVEITDATHAIRAATTEPTQRRSLVREVPAQVERTTM